MTEKISRNRMDSTHALLSSGLRKITDLHDGLRIAINQSSGLFNENTCFVCSS